MGQFNRRVKSTNTLVGNKKKHEIVNTNFNPSITRTNKNRSKSALFPDIRRSINETIISSQVFFSSFFFPWFHWLVHLYIFFFTYVAFEMRATRNTSKTNSVQKLGPFPCTHRHSHTCHGYPSCLFPPLPSLSFVLIIAGFLTSHNVTHFTSVIV